MLNKINEGDMMKAQTLTGVSSSDKSPSNFLISVSFLKEVSFFL